MQIIKAGGYYQKFNGEVSYVKSIYHCGLFGELYVNYERYNQKGVRIWEHSAYSLEKFEKDHIRRVRPRKSHTETRRELVIKRIREIENGHQRKRLLPKK